VVGSNDRFAMTQLQSGQISFKEKCCTKNDSQKDQQIGGRSKVRGRLTSLPDVREINVSLERGKAKSNAG